VRLSAGTCLGPYEILGPLARGLSAAHEKGIIHRDLKPENLFVTQDENVKILDFELARRSESAPDRHVTSARTEEQRTEPGTVLGTAGYMSPEQIRGQPVDHRSDIFSFGAVLYEMLTDQEDEPRLIGSTRDSREVLRRTRRLASTARSPASAG
jgi:serine/threonine protein kinase